MIKSLQIKDFRNFSSKELFFSEKRNIIVGVNGKGKTNILESIGILSLNSLIKVNFENLVKKDFEVFFLKVVLFNGDTIAISYDKKSNKKNYFLNEKRLSKSKLKLKGFSSVSFSPIIMNMFYLSPSLRRDFLDSTLDSAFIDYSKHLKKYKTIVQNRNKILKNIRENKSDKSEIIFWDEKFIELCKIIYNYRFGIIEYLQKNIGNTKKYFLGKVKKIELIYKTKVKKESLETDIRVYLDKNLDRDIMIGTSSIGPHIDDFKILADGINIASFASRGEIKSIIIDLKTYEIKFIEKYLKRKPLLLIDDLLSELDENHKEMILNKLKGYQTFISSINPNIDEEAMIFNLN